MKTSTIFFGKYKGQTWEQVKQDDPGYLMWMRNNMGWMDDPQPVIDIIDSLFTVKQDLMADQAVAADEISTMLLSGNNRVHRLQGGAGYGKSYVVTEIAQRAKEQGLTVTGIANSYVATQVLAESLDPVGVPSKTIASALQLKPNKDREKESYGPSEDTADNLSALLCEDSLLVVDEYSMCSDMVTDLIYATMNQPHNNSKLLVVGDSYQLPSPEQEWMCTFDKITPYSELTVPKRFEPKSDLHTLEKSVRLDPWNLGLHLNNLSTAYSYQVHHQHNKIKLAEQMLSDMEDHPDDSALMLFYKRADVAKANKMIRAAVYGESSDEIETGERLRVMRTTFMPTFYDIVKEKWEYTRYYSGTFLNAHTPEVATICVDFDHQSLPSNQCPAVEVECLTILDDDGHRIPVLFSKTENQADPTTCGGKDFNLALQIVRSYCSENDTKGIWKLYHHFRSKFLQISYGYATTVHRSQGASVDRIYLRPQDVLQGGRFIAPRLAYVAATRAKKAVNYTL